MPTVIQMRVWRQGGHPRHNLANKGASVLASLLHRPPWVDGIPLASCRTWGLFKSPVQARVSVYASADTHAHARVHRAHTHALIHSHSPTRTHTHTYTQTRLINPQITPPIITTLVLIRNYLKHFPIRVYVLSWAGVWLGNPTGLTAGGKNGWLVHKHHERVCVCAHTLVATRIFGSGRSNQAVLVQMRGRRKKEREIKQQRRAPLGEQQYCRSLLLGLGTVIRRGYNETLPGKHMPIRLPGEPQALIAMGNPPDSIQHCPLTQPYVVYFQNFGCIMAWEKRSVKYRWMEVENRCCHFSRVKGVTSGGKNRQTKIPG